MPIAESLLPEFDQETLTTRVLLERVPGDRQDWRPHERLRSLGELAMHLAGIPAWTSIALERREFDTRPPDDIRPAAPLFQSTPLLLASYDETVKAARAILVRTSDGEFMAPWTLKNGGRAMFSMPRVSAFRSFVMNHSLHHRGQLTVYLRLLDVPLPPMYAAAAASYAD